MAGLTLFNVFLRDLAQGVHDLSTDVLKLALTNTAPAAANGLFADLVEIAGVNGYPAGGAPVTLVSSAQTGGAYKLIVNDVTITATGGAIGPFRYIVVYNSTAATQPLIGFSDYGVAYTLPDTNPFTTDFDATEGILQLAAA